jgi:hypothetical protein
MGLAGQVRGWCGVRPGCLAMHLGSLWCATSQPIGRSTAFWGAFRRVLAGGGDISPLVQNLLDTLVCEVEFSLGAKGEVYDEPSLQEVVECIVTLHNATAPGADGCLA